MLLSITELARKLTYETGRHVSRQNIFQWCFDGIKGIKLPSRMLGGLWLIEWDDFLKWQAEVEKAHRQGLQRKRQKQQRSRRRKKCAA